MTEKERFQLIYRECRKDSEGDTDICLGFLKYLHEEHDGAKYLLDMPDITIVEREYIKQLLNK